MIAMGPFRVLDVCLILFLQSLPSLNHYLPRVSHLCPPLMDLNLLLLPSSRFRLVCIGSSVPLLFFVLLDY